MNHPRFIFTLVILLAVILTACGTGVHAITEGRLRDTIFSVEPRQNGTTTLWMTHDDVGAYCTMDAEIVAKAERAFTMTPDNEVIVTFRSINNNDPEWNWFGTGGCAQEGENTIIYRIIDVQLVSETQEGV